MVFLLILIILYFIKIFFLVYLPEDVNRKRRVWAKVVAFPRKRDSASDE